MALPVIVKSTKRGIQLVLDSEIPFNELADKIQEKFEASKEFFQDTSFSLSFSGRVLSLDEQRQIIQILHDSCNIEIVCILEENELLDDYIFEKMEQIALEKRQKSGQFHKGDIQAGQTLECDHSVVIIGSILPGGKVLSKGNIVVIGSLKGYAYAGVSGKRDAFICALDIDSDKLRIAEETLGTSRLFLHEKPNDTNRLPQIAFAKDKTIVIEPLTKGYLNKI